VSSPDGAARAVGICTGLAGALLLLRPKQVAANVRGSGLPPDLSVVRLLGSRYLVQAIAETSWPTRDVLRASRAVDALHAMTMLATALASPRYRSAACASLLLATASMASTNACLQRSRS
jgi:hypothetical protein